MRYLLLILLLAVLQGCVPAVPASEFAPTQEVLTYPANKRLLGKVTLGQVLVQDKAMGAVTPENVTAALTEALKGAGYMAAAADGAGYALKVVVVKLDWPMISLDLNVKATLRYELTKSVDGSAVYADNITIGHQVAFFQELDGNERLRKAIAKAVSGNITHFLRTLSVAKL